MIFNKSIFGMIHLAGNDPVTRALEEIKIFESEGLDGIIVENYHGTIENVIDTIDAIGTTKLLIGINILPNEVVKSYNIATDFKVDFIQFDYVSGSYLNPKGSIKLDEEVYLPFRRDYPNIKILGGVHPKYYTPSPKSDLVADIKRGIELSDALVVTGEKTGKETPLEKIKSFRELGGSHPLIIGAGVDSNNVLEQLPHADGAIVGSSFKPYKDTYKMINGKLVEEFMDKVRLLK